ncbi:melatonin receptor [Branchiostoma belcheri]|nr:melatonin receptor [Branchiostoma belcheri]
MAAELELPRVVMMILVVILIVVGTIGNLSIILVISLTKDLWTTTNTFIINLAVADLFVTIIVDPYNAVANLQADSVGQGDFILASCIHWPPVSNVRPTNVGYRRPMDTGGQYIE